MTLTRRTPLKAHKGLTPKKAMRPTLTEMQAKGLVTKASSFTQKPRKRIKARSPRNKGGQAALFRKVWESRPHSCEVCGAHIEEATASNFSHILGKGAYPSYKLDPRNCELWCVGCHSAWTNKTFRLRGGWIRVFEKFCDLRDEANGLTRKP